MGFKKRFKKALFAFFKDEIINSVGFNNSKKVIYVSKELNFVEIKSEIRIEKSNRTNNMPFDYAYEESLNKCRRDLFEEAMKHIQIDNQSVIRTNSYSNDTRAIKVSLFIGTKNQ